MMKVPTPVHQHPGDPMSQPTSPPAQIVADTIVRTVELGVRIIDAALAGETTVVFADLIVEGRGAARAAGWPGSIATASSAGSAMSRSSGIRSSCGFGSRATAVSTTAVPARSSPTTPAGWPAQEPRPLGAAPGSSCVALRWTRPPSPRSPASSGARWDTVNNIAVEATRELLLTAGPARLDGVRVIGVDEHKWAHVLGTRTPTGSSP